ncbi:MAG: hypothetical protein AAGJ82_11510 [Bacteroidota bacterium]
MKMYKIDPSATTTLAFRFALTTIGIMTGIVALLMVWLSFNLNPGASIGPIVGKLIPGFLLIIGLIAVMLTVQKTNFYGSTRFLLTDDTIASVLDNKELNGINQFGVARNRSRYGAEPNQVISFANISRVKITDKNIKIYGGNYSLFNGNGRIVIPKETENYEELLHVFKPMVSA